MVVSYQWRGGCIEGTHNQVCMPIILHCYTCLNPHSTTATVPPNFQHEPSIRWCDIIANNSNMRSQLLVPSSFGYCYNIFRPWLWSGGLNQQPYCSPTYCTGDVFTALRLTLQEKLSLLENSHFVTRLKAVFRLLQHNT